MKNFEANKNLNADFTKLSNSKSIVVARKTYGRFTFKTTLPQNLDSNLTSEKSR
jgi:hypothetical protein